MHACLLCIKGCIQKLLDHYGCLKQDTYQAPALFDKNVAAAEFVAFKQWMFMIK